MYRAAIGKMNRTFTVIVNGARLASTALVNWNGASRLTEVISSTQVTPTQSATDVTGKLAVKIAKLLGAGRVVAAGRNQQVLTTLGKLGADATIRLDAPAEDLGEAFVREAGEQVFKSSSITCGAGRQKHFWLRLHGRNFSAPHRYARLAVFAAWTSPLASERLVEREDASFFKRNRDRLMVGLLFFPPVLSLAFSSLGDSAL
jgi:hypothetical protein